MSYSIVLAVGGPGLRAVAVALGLLSGLALVLRRPTPRPRAALPFDGQALAGVRPRPELAALLASWRRWLRSRAERPSAPPAEREASPAEFARPARVPVIGYATFSGRAGKESDQELAQQADVVARACDQRGLALLEMVGDPHTDQRLVRPSLTDERPGLRYALDRIAAGEARGLVVPGLRRLGRSVSELGPIVEWCARREARLVAVAQGFDTAERECRLAARLLIELSRWERERGLELDREGLSPSHDAGASNLGAHQPDVLDRSGGESS